MSRLVGIDVNMLEEESAKMDLVSAIEIKRLKDELADVRVAYASLQRQFNQLRRESRRYRTLQVSANEFIEQLQVATAPSLTVKAFTLTSTMSPVLDAFPASSYGHDADISASTDNGAVVSAPPAGSSPDPKLYRRMIRLYLEGRFGGQSAQLQNEFWKLLAQEQEKQPATYFRLARAMRNRLETFSSKATSTTKELRDQLLKILKLFVEYAEESPRTVPSAPASSSSAPRPTAGGSSDRSYHWPASALSSKLTPPVKPQRSVSTPNLLANLTASSTFSNEDELVASDSKGFIPNNDSVLHLHGRNEKLVLGMIGLPARGKSYIAKKLARFLSWIGYKTKVFNIGNYRREMVGAEKKSSFFDPDNLEAVREREKCAQSAIDDMLQYFRDGGNAAVFDGTNSTNQRRRMVANYIRDHYKEGVAELVWIESICDIEDIVRNNIKQTKLSTPDYVNMDPEDAMKDFLGRIANYERAYETLTDESQSWVKLINTGRQVVVNRMFGYLPTRLVFFLQNLNTNKQPIYLCRHGQSIYNTENRVGGDSDITPLGQDYADRLATYLQNEQPIKDMIKEGRPLRVWCSTLKRTQQTAAPLVSSMRCEFVAWRSLNELDSGTCESMTYSEIQKKFPNEFAARRAHPFRYRYPAGESYEDLLHRLEGVIFELERVKGPVVVIAHKAVLRCLYGYFRSKEQTEIPHIPIPLHTVIKLNPKAYDMTDESIVLHPESPLPKEQSPLTRTPNSPQQPHQLELPMSHSAMSGSPHGSTMAPHSVVLPSVSEDAQMAPSSSSGTSALPSSSSTSLSAQARVLRVSSAPDIAPTSLSDMMHGDAVSSGPSSATATAISSATSSATASDTSDKTT